MKSAGDKMALAAKYLDGEASAEEVTRLESWMEEDVQLRSDFLAYARVDAALPGVVSGVALVKEEPKKTNWSVWLSLAAAVILTLFFIFNNGPQAEESPAVATFGELSNCRWIDSSSAVLSGDVIREGGRIELSEGTAEMIFETGARLTLVGPAIVETRSTNGIFLTMGEASLVARTPESKGFVIETPSSKFVDISTAFTAAVSPDGLSRVDVTEGEVDVVVGGMNERLRAGQAMYVEPGEKKIVTRIEAGDGTPDFRFPTIAPPGSSDYADRLAGVAEIRVVDEKSSPLSAKSGPLEGLLDGKGQSTQDAPRESVFFERGRVGRFVIDLGKPVSIAQINSYSWHQHEVIGKHRERARQRYQVFGLTKEQETSFSTIEQPIKNGWTRIARVNSDRFFKVSDRLERPAQQACAIVADQGNIGTYRYLLWVVDAGSFYGEIDIFEGL